MRRMVVLLGALVALVLLTAAPASSSTGCQITNKETDTTYTSLLSAVNAASDGDTLLIQNVCGGNIEIHKSLTLEGQHPAGSLPPTIGARAGATQPNILSISRAPLPNHHLNIRITNLRITGGRAVGLSNGGGIDALDDSTLTLNNVRVMGNRAESGGGIATNGPLILNGHTKIVRNSAAFGGGGIFISPDGNVILNDSSKIAHNTARSGGGVDNFDGFLAMQGRSTIFRNKADDAAGVFLFATSFLVMNGDATITENDVGGVFVGEQASIVLNGGSVFNNVLYNICGNNIGCS